MKPLWQYLRQGAMMPSADSMSNPLERTSLTETELLMREAIQNSVDERKKDVDGPTKFVIRRLLLRGDEKRALVTNLRLDEMSDRAQQFPTAHGWFEIENTCLVKLTDPDAAIPILILSDHNTNGLGGRWNKTEGPGSRFHNLVLSIYRSEKPEIPGQLGSYGAGKMVYAVTSNIRTMAYYSTFDSTDASEGASARFMSAAFLPGHDNNDGTRSSGHAFFGVPTGHEDYPAKPLENAEAHEFAEAMGLEKRSDKDTGLTVVLIDCPISVDDCRTACETFWWPKIIDTDSRKHVELEFFDEDRHLSGPTPRQRSDLNPFIDCFSNLQQDLKPAGYENKPIRLQSFGLVGQLGLKAIAEAEVFKKDPLTNSVALIRDGLVIQYNVHYTREGDPPVIGVFEAQGIKPKQAFMLSEPEAHDEWNSNIGRLKRSHEDFSTLVRLTHDRIKMGVRDYQTRQKEKPPKPDIKGLNFLDDLLGPLFRRRKGSSKPPPSKRRAFSITKSGSRDHSSDPAQDNLDFSISLMEDLNVSSVECRINLNLKVLVDADGHPKDAVPYEIFTKDGHVVASDDGGGYRVNLKKGVPVKFQARAAVHKSWRTKWTISVSMVDDKATAGGEA